MARRGPSNDPVGRGLRATDTRTGGPRDAAEDLRLHQRLTRVYGDGLVLSPPICTDATGRKIALGRDSSQVDIVVDDDRVSRRHAVLAPALPYELHRLTDLESKNGTFVNGERIAQPTLVRDGDVIRIGETLFVYEVATASDVDPLACPPGRALRHQSAVATADLAACSDLPVLLNGPTGAGKEITARRIHEGSGRAGPFVAVNCAAFSSELLASELFGHVKGAFSGALSSRVGLFRSAAGGTLFLDEIGDMPLAQQPSLLRALQERKVRPVGSDADEPVDVRIMAATHQDLSARVDAGGFREDLLARVSAIVLDVPSLRERRVEILAHLARSSTGDRRFTAAAAEALLAYDWPRNFRELEQLAARFELWNRREVSRSSLPPEMLVSTARPSPDGGRPSREQLEAALQRARGNVAAAARSLGVHRNQLYRWLDSHGLDAGRFRS